MEKEEMKELVALIAKTTTQMVVTQLRSMRELSDTEYVDTREAARILGVSPAYLRQVKEKYPHVKGGTCKQGHIMFRRDDLLKSVEK